MSDLTAPTDPTKTFTRQYVYDGQEIVDEYDGSGSLLAHYTHSGLRTDDVLGVNVTTAGVTAKIAANPGSYEYLKDGQGTITDVTDTAGTRIEHYIYSAFGILLGIQDAYANDVTASPPVATSYGFTGRELDRESGLMYYRARYYNPSLGRFLQKDSFPGELELPGSVISSYDYVANNSRNLSDPSGRLSWLEGVLIGIGVAVVSVATLGVADAIGAGVAGSLGLGGLAAAAATTAIGAVVSAGIAVGTGLTLAGFANAVDYGFTMQNFLGGASQEWNKSGWSLAFSGALAFLLSPYSLNFPLTKYIAGGLGSIGLNPFLAGGVVSLVRNELVSLITNGTSLSGAQSQSSGVSGSLGYQTNIVLGLTPLPI